MKYITINNNTIRISKIDLVRDVIFRTAELTSGCWVELSVIAFGEVFSEVIFIKEEDWCNFECKEYLELSDKRKRIKRAMERMT